MKPALHADALFYPFHLCHEETLTRLLTRFYRIHFRDYMALRLTPFSGTTAYEDRMGGTFPELVASGRLVQGYNVSGPLTDETRNAIDRDLADQDWRTLFHQAFKEDRRVQRGLFDPTHAMPIGRDLVPGPAALLRLMSEEFHCHLFTVAEVQDLSAGRLSGEAAYRFEYGLALIKTAAALRYTIALAETHHLAVATDSSAHCHLLSRMLTREKLTLSNHLVIRTGY